MRKYVKENRAEQRVVYTFKEQNALNETIVVEINKVFVNNKDKNSLPKLWKKEGYTEKLYDSYIFLESYAIDKNGMSYGKYNPTIKTKRQYDPYTKKLISYNVINFDNIYEVSEENIKRLLGMVERIAFDEV